MTDAYRVGDRASLDHTFTSAEVADFARLSGDVNPIHLETAAATAAGFERSIVHGALVLGLISRLLGTRLPGPGTILLQQNLRYLRPVYPGQAVRASVEITSARDDKPIFGLRTWVETDEVVLEGDATVIVRAVTAAGDARPAEQGPGRR